MPGLLRRQRSDLAERNAPPASQLYVERAGPCRARRLAQQIVASGRRRAYEREPVIKAICYDAFGGPEVLRYGDLPIPEPGSDEVLVRVAAAAVNPIDRRLRTGELQEYFTRDFPITPGWDFSGRIERSGSAVVGFRPGDDVLGLAFTWHLHGGTYAEFACVEAQALAALGPSQSRWRNTWVRRSIPPAVVRMWILCEASGRKLEDLKLIMRVACSVGRDHLQDRVARVFR